MTEVVKNAIEKEGVIAIVRKLYGNNLMKLADTARIAAGNDGAVGVHNVYVIFRILGNLFD